MTMPNSFPGPDPEEFERHSEDVERFDTIFDTLDILALVDELHIYRQGALELDEHTRNQLVRMRKHFGEAVLPQATYLRPLVFDEEVSVAPYDEMVWAPLPQVEDHADIGDEALTSSRKSLEDVERVVLRFPQLAGQSFGLSDDELPRETNDVLVEVQYAGDIRYRYLINSRGITPYADAESLDFDDAEMDREGVAPNVFRVNTDFWHVPPLTSAKLRLMLAGCTPLPLSA